MRNRTVRLVCSVLSLLIWLVPATAQEYWNYKTAYMAYDRGEFTLAADMFKRLAAKGHMRAQNDLAFLYEIGQGVAPNRKKAALWYRKAADQGYGPAQYRVADLYLAGRGITKDVVEAHKWFSLASLLNRDPGRRDLANDRRKALENQLSGSQLVTARTRACRWWQSFTRNKPSPHRELAGCASE